MFNDRLPERAMADYVPLFDHATRRVVLLKDSSAFVMFEVDGLPVQTLETDVLYRMRSSLNHGVSGLGSHGGLELHSWVCRGYADASIYPTGEFSNAFTRRLDQRYRKQLLANNLYLNRTYLGLLLRPARFAGDWADDYIPSRSRDSLDETPVDRIKRLVRIADIVEGDLEPYQPRRLGLREKNGRTFSEIAEALVFAMTGVWRSVGLQAYRRIGMLFSEKTICGAETIEIRTPGQSSWAACFGAKRMMWNCPPGVLDGFLTTEFRSTIYQSFRILQMNQTLTRMGRKQNRMLSAGDRAVSQIKELDAAQDEIQSGRMILGDYSLVVTAFADALNDMPSVANTAWHTLQDAGAQVAREDDALEAAYYSMLLNTNLRPRPGAATSYNFASLAGMHSFPSGAETGAWGGPLALFRTTGGTPYRFHLHTRSKVANVFVFGETGSGKSVWLCFIAAQAERLGIQIVFWDKDRGAEIMVRAVGGRYLSIRNPTGLAPLKAYANRPEDIHQLSRLIRGAIDSPTPHDWTPEESRRLFVGLQGIMSLPPQDRWLIDLRAFLGTDPKGAGAKLEKWCVGNEYGFVMDGEVDLVDLNAPVLGFDVTDFLSDAMVAGPVMTDLLYRTAKLADGRRILYIVDEAWKVVRIPQFADAAMDHLKVDRKLNAGLILGSQSIRDARDSPIGYTIREQAKTVVAFAVERPDRDDFRWLHYTDRECEIIEDLKPGTGLHLLRQDGKSVVCQIPLAGMDAELAVLSGNARNVKALDRVRVRIGDVSPDRLVDEFLAEVGLA